MILRDLLEKVDIVDAAADMGIEVHGVSYDTRTLRAGEIFVAINGYEFDGHRFIPDAVEKGAVCVICEKTPEVETPYILVDDARKTLAAVSCAWFKYPASKLKMIGVTGTNGKTTVTTLIKQTVEKCSGKKAGLIGTNCNMIGDRRLPAGHTTPESYEVQALLEMMVREGCEYVVMEVSSHALRLSRVHGIVFEVGVFTNLSPEHLDFHASMDEYAEAKSQMFRNCLHAAVNADDGYSGMIIANADCPVFTFAVNEGTADLVAKSIKLHTDRVDFCALTVGRLNRVEIRIPGLFTVYNALSAIAAVALLGFDVESITAVLQTCQGVKGRAEVVPAGQDFTVLIDYAHTPDALKNIITSVRACTQGRVVTLFGCGGDRDRKKRPLMGETAVKYSDLVIVTSDNPRTEEPMAIINEILPGLEGTKTPYRVIESRLEAICWTLENAEPGDVVILAGKGHETYQILGKEKRHFDEREVVAEFFSRVQSAECRVKSAE